jgi:signal transduction histidine kinase
MSAATSFSSAHTELPRRTHEMDPLPLLVLEIGSFILTLALIGWNLARNWGDSVSLLPNVIPWLVAAIAADLLAIPVWGSVELMMSFPILLASSFVFPPYVAGLIGFFGTVDKREFKREIPAARGLLNRSNVALSVMAAGWAFHEVGGNPLEWPAVLAPALVALLIDLAINASLVVLGMRLLTGISSARLVSNVYGGGQSFAFAAGYLCFGLLAVVLATVYAAAGAWGVLAFAIPLLLARQMFAHWKSLAEVRIHLDQQQKLLTDVTSRMADERRDERLAVAAGIHDEVLPPLYKVHLMGQVLRQDLATGRLLDLEADLPDLLRATEAASDALRDMIRDLRSSTLGAGGLAQTLNLLARSLQDESGIPIDVHMSEIRGSALTHLLLYQVVREALSNSVKYSHASQVRVVVEDEPDGIRLIVEDDGQGFEPAVIDLASHFGIQLMRERVELAGGAFHLDTAVGSGTRIVVRVPVDTEKRA